MAAFIPSIAYHVDIMCLFAQVTPLDIFMAPGEMSLCFCGNKRVCFFFFF